MGKGEPPRNTLSLNKDKKNIKTYLCSSLTSATIKPMKQET